jgi:hypothetical protein
VGGERVINGDVLTRRVMTKGWWTVLFGIVGQAICTGQAPSLPNGNSLISRQNLIPPLVSSLQAMGARMQTADKAQITLVGTVADSRGSRSAQITVQAPGYWAYRESSSRAVTFDGTNFTKKSGPLTPDDEAVGESLLAHLPDSVFLQVAFGGKLTEDRIAFSDRRRKEQNVPRPILDYICVLRREAIGARRRKCSAATDICCHR